MSPAALLFALAAATAAPPAEGGAGRGAQVVQAQARATIVKAAAVRQGTGMQPGRDTPLPQISRRGQTILVEFE